MGRFNILNLEENAHDDIVDDNNNFEIDEFVENTELTFEIYNDKNKLETYILALEDGFDTYDRLVKQLNTNNDILNTTNVSLEEVSISNTCLNICKAQLGYDTNINYSSESDMTNYERLQVSNEGIREFMINIVNKIVELFIKIANFFRKLYAKIILWLNLYESKVDNLKKDILCVLTQKDCLVPRVVVENILNILKDVTPMSDESYNSKKDNLKEMLKTDLDVTKNFNRLLNNPKDLDKILNCLVLGKMDDSVFTFEERDRAKSEDGCVLITRINKGKVFYLLSKNNKNRQTIEFKDTYIRGIDTTKTKFENNWLVKKLFNVKKIDTYSVNKKDIVAYLDNLKDKLIKDLKKNGNNLFKLQDDLIKKAKNKIDSGEIKDSDNKYLKAISFMGSRAALNSVFWMFDTIKAGLKIAATLHNSIASNLPNYLHALKVYQEGSYDFNMFNSKTAELKFLHNDKKYPYISVEMKSLFSNCSGFCLSKRDKYDNVFGLDCDYETVIHISNEFDNFVYKNIVKYIPFIKGLATDYTYFHEMGHAIVQTEVPLPKNIMDLYHEIQHNARVLELAGKLEKADELELIENYVNSPVENQADAFAIYKMGANLAALFRGGTDSFFGDLKLRKKYIENLKKQMPLVSKYASQTWWAKVKSMVRGYHQK